MQKLLPVAFGHGMAADAVAGGPAAVFGHVVGAEDLVEEGEVDGEIHVDGLLFDAVMPMMEAWRDEQLFEEAELPAEIRVYKGGVEVNDEDVGIHGALAKAEHDHRNDGGAA